jgi:hypothetical protein
MEQQCIYYRFSGLFIWRSDGGGGGHSHYYLYCWRQLCYFGYDGKSAASHIYSDRELLLRRKHGRIYIS